MIKVRRIHRYLVAIALTSWGLVQWLAPDETRQATTTHGAEYFGTGYTKWEMNELGKLKNKLVADKITHYDDDTTQSIKPVMFFYNEKTPPWVVTSETGVLSADGKDLLLQGKTIVHRSSAAGVKELTIHTANLRVKPDTSYAETDEWTELLSPPNITTGTGMKTVFANPVHIELLVNVKGKYETKKKK
jgi:lipopolysaccharide export system protein LptC